MSERTSQNILEILENIFFYLHVHVMEDWTKRLNIELIKSIFAHLTAVLMRRALLMIANIKATGLITFLRT